LGEDRFHQLARVRRVVHDEDPDAVERRKSTRRQCSGHDPDRLRLAGGTLVRDRKGHRESCPASGPGALGMNGPALELDEIAHDDEPDPQTFLRLPDAVRHHGRGEDL